MVDKTLASGLRVMLNNAYQEKLENKMFKHKRKQKRIGNTPIKMPLFKAGVCLLLGSFSALLLAETQPAIPATSSGGASAKIEPQTTTPSTGNPRNEAKKTPVLVAPKAATRDQKDVFKPSEEISEDFAVPFPVDI